MAACDSYVMAVNDLRAELTAAKANEKKTALAVNDLRAELTAAKANEKKTALINPSASCPPGCAAYKRLRALIPSEGIFVSQLGGKLGLGGFRGQFPTLGTLTEFLEQFFDYFEDHRVVKPFRYQAETLETMKLPKKNRHTSHPPGCEAYERLRDLIPSDGIPVSQLGSKLGPGGFHGQFPTLGDLTYFLEDFFDYSKESGIVKLFKDKAASKKM
eukprot:NODE_4478_length_781_cov_38.402141_g4319_i0.p1 GENE.NODE_4478_length_781_cov_38.402141_g4319_i0~~NODE_4478_length_781_cov_38.402141_g4319_i0.p1  ORF type:complete len:229 (+),score=39.62 NODE_4478_length_781_cov_38.402141_g4319_i0:45-689(+)